MTKHRLHCLLAALWVGGLVLSVALPQGSSAAQAEEVGIVSSEEIATILTRDITVVPRLDAKGYTKPESSKHVSLDTIRFSLDSAELRPAAKSQLDEFIRAFGAMTTSRVLVWGHTCDRGDAQHNLTLSDKRARAVRTYLLDHNIGPGKVDTHGWGETKPLVPNTSEADRVRNRRVDFVLLEHDEALQIKTRDLLQSTTASTRFLDARFEAIATSKDSARYSNDKIDKLTEGDRFGAHFTVLESSHIYCLYQDQHDEVLWLRIDAPTQNEWLVPQGQEKYGTWCYFGEKKYLPSEASHYVLDENPGTEILYLIATHAPILQPASLPAILRQHGITLTAETLRAATGTDDAELHMLVIDHT